MKSTIAAKRRREGYLFILPGFLYMLIILGYPLVYNIILSFKNVNVKTFASGTSVFVGMQNYIDLFHNDTFLLVMKNTFVFTIWCLIIFLSEIYVVRSDPRHGAGRIYDADVCYGSAWKEYV